MHVGDRKSVRALYLFPNFATLINKAYSKKKKKEHLKEFFKLGDKE